MRGNCRDFFGGVSCCTGFASGTVTGFFSGTTGKGGETCFRTMPSDIIFLPCDEAKSGCIVLLFFVFISKEVKIV